jgi:hypothetical protein
LKTIRLYPECDNALSFLSGPMKEMFAIMDRYVDDHKSDGYVDMPYHYNERATLSILAGAIWRSDANNLVLEEFGTQKKWSEGEYRGRRDIWFRASGRRCFGEVKQEGPQLSRRRTNIAKLLNVLQIETQTVQQALSNVPAPERPEIGLGILFIAPWALQANIMNAEERLDKYHRALESGLELWCGQNELQVLWASYIRPDLLKETGCTEWRDGKKVSCPCLDTLICTIK